MKSFKQTIREEQHKLTLIVDYKRGLDDRMKIILDLINEKYKANGERYKNDQHVQYRFVGNSRQDLINVERLAKLFKDVDVYYE